MQRERESVCRPPVRVGLSRMLQCLLCCPFSRGTASGLRHCQLPTRHQALLSGCPAGKIVGRAVEMPCPWRLGERAWLCRVHMHNGRKPPEVAPLRRTYVTTRWFRLHFIDKQKPRYHEQAPHPHLSITSLHVETLFHQNASRKYPASG